MSTGTEKDEFLSSVIGVESYKITEPDKYYNTGQYSDVIQKPFEYIRLPPNQASYINELVDCGFNVICQELELINNVERFVCNDSSSFIVRHLPCMDSLSCKKIIDSLAISFVYDRFNQDTDLKKFSYDIKRKWINNIFIGERKSDFLYFAISDSYSSEVVGFLSAVKEGYRRARIELIGVVSGYQGKGLGSSLIRRLCSDIYLDEIVVNTQANNYPAINLYKKMGFQINQVYTVLHRFNKGE